MLIMLIRRKYRDLLLRPFLYRPYNTFIMSKNDEIITNISATHINRAKHLIDTDDSNDIILPDRKMFKRTSSVHVHDIEKDIMSCSLNEVSLKLKSLFNILGEKFEEQKHIFTLLTETLNQNLTNTTTTTLSFINPTSQNNITQPDITSTTAYLGSSPAKTPIEKSVSFRETVDDHPDENLVDKEQINHNIDPIPKLNSSPMMKESTKALSIDQRRNYGTLHMATQNNMTTPASKHSVKHIKPIILSQEQEIVAELARRGNNIFYTGSAGTGKSLLLKKLIKNLKEQHPPDSIGVTASTGLAAYNIGGMTINSYTGIGLGTGKVDDMVRNIKRNKKIRERWDKLKVLIIDEISMIDGFLLDKLDNVAKRLRDPNKPFGGIQVIFCGDFYQLPPVSKDNSTIFAFESAFWKPNIRVQVILKKVFRQEGDKQFLKMLQEVRDGEVTESTSRKFRALSRPLVSKDNLIPTRLFPTRKEVDIANNRMLKNLPGGTITYTAMDGGKLGNTPQGQKMLESFLAPKLITLKPGAQVMMIKNIDDTLVNGSLGTVVGFLNNETYCSYMNLHEELSVMAENSGTKDDKAAEEEKQVKENKEDKLELMKVFEEPNDSLTDSIFDFLGKVKSKIRDEIASESPARNKEDSKHLETDSEATFEQTGATDPNALDTSKLSIDVNHGEKQDPRIECIERKETLLNALKVSENAGNVLPLVCFRLANGSSRTVLVERETFTIEDDFHNPIVSRQQVPLMLAWALSIHKSQGQTLKFVSVDLKKIFENGQAYVALSRAEHRRGLQVLNFSPSKITTDPKVKRFYANLTDAETAIKNVTSGNFEQSKDIGYLNRPTGFQTQVKNLQELSASPERFAKFANKSQEISRFFKPQSNNKENNKDGEMNGNTKENTTTTDNPSLGMPLSGGDLMSEDENESFQRLFLNSGKK